MKWEDLLSTVRNEPVFDTGFLAAETENLAGLRLQISRWVKAGKLIMLKKGLYTLAHPYSKVTPHPFLIANAVNKPSYVSLQSALGYYGIIPEYVVSVTSVTVGRPGQVKTRLGNFVYQHIRKSWFHGFEQVALDSGQKAFIAIPEKALLDLVYLTPKADDYDFLSELRLQNLDQMKIDLLGRLANKSGSAKLCRAAKIITELIEQGTGKEL